MPDPPFSESVALLADVGLCGAGANEAPHEPQNVDPAIASVPHFEQNTVGGVGVAVPEEVIAERPTSAFFHEIEPPRLDPRHLCRCGEAVQEHDRNRRFA
ncbi:MAG: hypothetical protein EBY60_06855, partial [Actinobacteria bacterium]|nr:hypothetical protein [Actinomycetota bacterium]